MEILTNNQVSTSVSVDEISDPSGNEISEQGAENVENTNIPAIKVSKSTKAGERAQQETIDKLHEKVNDLRSEGASIR
ncbi:hypothetical protein QN277_005791 [Acacia crassicarpa]|uniref:Uncharacterized protein n=1 Tax=Acacia crassicarpa TaxID=499986 RepID=A0AAE1MA44_9FABA|nr:hypothetical protein QN277_005791 [Acacia crassicarpa]